MGHVVKDLPWCVIDVNTTGGRIFLQQRWKYTWTRAAGQSAWALQEKRDFHNRADRYIWAAWSNRAVFGVTGTSSFARRFRARGVPINLDIRWVTGNEHWKVTVKKIAAAAHETSSILWTPRTIKLDTNDFKTRTFGNGPAPSTGQVPVAHEFGHTIGNTSVLNRGDEYRATSPNRNDHSSIMNHGSQLRSRHFQTILDEMNTMIPNCTFSIRSV